VKKLHKHLAAMTLVGTDVSVAYENMHRIYMVYSANLGSIWTKHSAFWPQCVSMLLNSLSRA
jgi:hypothetical protein